MSVVLGGLFFLAANPARETTASSFVERVQTPDSAAAPEAVEEPQRELEPRNEAAVAEREDQGGARGGSEEGEGSQEENRADEDPAPPPPEDPTLYLTVPSIGIHDHVVANSSEPSALDYGAAKLEQSGFPWESEVNTYISAHRLGWPGTPSDHQFYNLPLMQYGDEVYLTDANGTVYTYEVTEIIEVSPQDVWVSHPEDGRDIVSLQTCTEDYGDLWTMGPDWATRLVVRADKVDVTHV